MGTLDSSSDYKQATFITKSTELSVALSAYIGRRLVHLYLWRQLLGTPNL